MFEKRGTVYIMSIGMNGSRSQKVNFWNLTIGLMTLWT